MINNSGKCNISKMFYNLEHFCPKQTIVQKHLQLYDLTLGEYLVNKYALWLDFRTIDENELHRTDRHIENASEGITLQIEKKTESAGALNAYIYLIMDAQLNI